MEVTRCAALWWRKAIEAVNLYSNAMTVVKLFCSTLSLLKPISWLWISIKLRSIFSALPYLAFFFFTFDLLQVPLFQRRMLSSLKYTAFFIERVVSVLLQGRLFRHLRLCQLLRKRFSFGIGDMRTEVGRCKVERLENEWALLTKINWKSSLRKSL